MTFAVAAPLIGLVSTLAQGAAAYQAQQNSAKIAKQQAQLEERKQRRQLLLQYGSARAQFAAAGVNLDGSVSDVLDDLTTEGELNALSIRYQGAVRAHEARTRARLGLLNTGFQALGQAVGSAGSFGSGESGQLETHRQIA